MLEANVEKNPKPFHIPETIKFINVDLLSGNPSDKNFITEAFKSSFSFDEFNLRDDKNNLRGFY